MGLASNDYIDVLWKLVRSMDNDEEATWGMVKMGLNMEGVDTNARKQEDWMKSVNTLRLALREEGKMTRAGRADSMESERKADMVSLSDSVTTLESEDQIDQSHLVYVLNERYKDGQIPIYCCCSDQVDEHYITETICERLGLQAGADGKVTLTCLQAGEGRRFEARYDVRPHEEGVADIVFSTKALKMAEEDISRHAGDPEIRDLSSPRDNLERFHYPASDPHIDVSRTKALTLAELLKDHNIQVLDEERWKNVVRKLDQAVKMPT